MPLDAFIRSVGVSADSAHSFLLGAGASVTAGIPSAGQCIWDWKRRLFLTNHHGLEDQFAELSLPSVRERIQRWLDASRYPPDGSPDEYGVYIEKCYPIPEDRRRYFQSLIRGVKPNPGYRLLALLAEAGICDSVWTTNFDGLAAKAAVDTSVVAVEVGIDSAQRAVRQPTRGELLCVSLHGDYRYDRLKNTPPELQQQDQALRTALISRLTTSTLIAVGYSGRDASVMSALADACRHPGTGSLFWCGYGDEEPKGAVKALIETARQCGRTSYYVPASGFDDLMSRLSLYTLRGELLVKARAIVTAGSRAAGPQRTPFAIEPRPTVAVVKANAVRVDLPSDALEVAARLPTQQVWKWVRERVAGKPVVAVPFHRKLLALGTTDALRDAFEGELAGPVSRTPISRPELEFEDGAVTCLLRAALVQCLGQKCGLVTDGERELWEPAAYESRRADGAMWKVHKAVRISLRTVSGNTVMTLDPTVHASDAKGQTAPLAATKVIRTEILGYQHNTPYNTDLEYWRKKFVADGVELEFPPNCGSTFRFRLDKAPLYARIGGEPSDRALALKPEIERTLTQVGFVRPEPQLVFASASKPGAEVRDPYPIRGIARNRPFDFALSRTGLADRVSVGVVCPQNESRKCGDFLTGLLRSFSDPRGGQEYLLDYPGFQSAFGLPLHLPTPGGEGWAVCAEPPATGDDSKDGLELARRIINGIEELRSSAAPGVVVVFVPSRWRRCRNGVIDGARFDLHDHVKAYCVRRGVATQFIEEETVSDPQPYRVCWWLALALYVKTRRTPWLLDSLAPGTAYVGFGMSVDRYADRGQRLLLGCSHIYSARGEGLRYRLSKIDNPIFRRRNAFLGEEDARRVGGTILELYFESAGQLPDRVVVHKRTPFAQDEIKGLRDGLGNVAALDLLEINYDPSLMYVASAFDSATGGLNQGGFPVQRGTAVLLDSFTALLWSHGSTRAIDGRKTYYQGKRRIPAPLVVRRHLGDTPLRLLADEVLGLTKMNWNTFDMYTKLPATVSTSNEIARIGSLLERFTEASYDYRLFM